MVPIATVFGLHYLDRLTLSPVSRRERGKSLGGLFCGVHLAPLLVLSASLSYGLPYRALDSPP